VRDIELAVGSDSVEKQVVRDFVALLNAGADARALLSERVIVTINGTTPLSGQFQGLELVCGILVDSAKVVISTLTVEIRELIGRGPGLAALLKISGRSTAGTPFNEEGRHCGCTFSVNGGRIEAITLFPDTSLIETALYRRRYVPDG
jgi:ketosteroid isomerase-like protein